MVCLSLGFLATACSLASESLIVGDGGSYSSVQSAIDAASPGSTILVHSGTYREDLHVDKQVTLKGVDSGNGLPVIYGSGSGDVITITADGVRLEGFVVKNSEKYASAILIESNDNQIVGNTITDSNEGIHLDHGDRNLVTGNTLIGNHGDSIYIHYSDDNVITNNYAENNQFGIQGYNLRGNVISGNTCDDNTEIDLYLEQVSDTLISDNRIESNEASSRSGGDGIGMRYGTNVTIRDNYVGKHYYGIKVYYSNTTTVFNNTAVDSGVNIRFDFGTHDSVISNNTVRNGVDNILVAGECSNIFIEYNLVSSGKDSIYLFGSGDNIVRHNNVYDSTYGIRLYKSTDNLITQNYLHDNENNLYPSGAGSTVSDNDRRANYYGEEPAVTPTPGTSVDATALPTPRPGEEEDFFSWLWRTISSLLSL
ncbi:right-handed parallel beta-helix repeat-containing protein [Methanocella sp. MCL-LM]|uniref:right-handed parallel beta-helix repeat-containing protein n=1 Tax=Methanocella sp. MCL-LM TaxID=3412035 RepID=UPI003C747332